MKRRKPREGIIWPFLLYFSDFIYHAVTNGFFGRIFTSYHTLDRHYLSSGVGRRLNTDRGGRLHRVVCRNVAATMEQNRVLGFFRRAARSLSLCGLRTVGLFLLVSGVYTAVIYWLSAVVWSSNSLGWVTLPAGLIAMLVGILLLFSDLSLGFALGKGVFFRSVLMELFGLSDDALRNVPQKGKQHYVIAVPLGMAVGAISAWLHPLLVVGAVLAVLLASVVLSVPETGVLLLFLVLPFVGFLPHSSLFVLLAVLLPLAGYIGKLLRGNRAFHTRVQDLPVAVLLLLVLLSSFSLAEGAWRGAFFAAIMMSVYFLVLNVMVTPRWISRGRAVLMISATVASLVGILQFVLLAVAQADGVGNVMDIGRGVRAGFADHTTFAYFLTCVFPLALSSFFGSQRQHRVMMGLCSLLIVVTAVLTFVQSAWIALFAVSVIFFLLYNHRSLPFFLIGGGVFASLYTILPYRLRAYLLRLLQGGAGSSLSELSVSEVLFADRGLFAEVSGLSRFLFGYGHGGFETVCRSLSLGDTATLLQNCGFWLYLLTELGILGVLAMATFIFFVLQCCFSAMRGGGAGQRRNAAISGIAMMASVLVMGLFRYAWYDPAAMGLFFAIAALILAELRYLDPAQAAPEAGEISRSYAEIDYYVGF